MAGHEQVIQGGKQEMDTGHLSQPAKEGIRPKGILKKGRT